MLHKVYHEHFSAVYTMKLSWNTYFGGQKKTQKELKELKIVYQYAIYDCISWDSKICLIPVKKCWYQQNSRGVSRDSYIFWVFFT